MRFKGNRKNRRAHMKKLMTIVSLACIVMTLDCGAEPNIDNGTLNGVQSAAPVKDVKEDTDKTSKSQEVQSGADVSGILSETGFSQVKISSDELNLLEQNSQQASDIEATSEMWKILSEENQNSNN